MISANESRLSSATSNGEALRLVFLLGLFSATALLRAAPVINAGGVVNASGYQTVLSPGVVFVIFGSNLGPTTLQPAPAPSYSASLGGTSIAFTPAGGGSPFTAKVIFTSAGEVAGFLPSSVTPGSYSVVVTYNSQASAAQTVTVMARSFGIATSNSAGSGEAQATIGNVNNGLTLVRFTSGSIAYDGYTWILSPAHPGDTVVLWGTGGGADPANDTGGSSGDQTAAGNFVVTVDGTQIPPLYAGTSSGYPGLWQINFTLPSTIGADCFASVQVSAGGVPGNSATLSIAAAGQSSCSSQISASTLSSLDSGGNVTDAALVLEETIDYTSGMQTSEAVGAVFAQLTAYAFLFPLSGPQIGGCRITQETYAPATNPPSSASAGLDAGQLQISGPDIPQQNIPILKGATFGQAYDYNLPTLEFVGGGIYTIASAGGTQVGPFTATATFPVSFSSNVSTLGTVDHAQPLTFTWSGSGFDLATASISATVSPAGLTSTTTVYCTAAASQGELTVPTSALAYLPVSGTWQVQLSAEQGNVMGDQVIPSTQLRPPLVGGGQMDFGEFTAIIVHFLLATVN